MNSAAENEKDKRISKHLFLPVSYSNTTSYSKPNYYASIVEESSLVGFRAHVEPSRGNHIRDRRLIINMELQKNSPEHLIEMSMVEDMRGLSASERLH